MGSDEKLLVHLLVVNGPDQGKMFFLGPKKEAVIGRSLGATLRITDPGASQKHCVVRSVGSMVFIEDLNSKNGTLVNGEPIASRILDEDGRITVGDTVIQVTWVATEREVPLSAVESPNAPTLIDTQRVKTESGRMASQPGSTITDADMFEEYRASRAQLGSSIDGFLLLEVIGVGSMGVTFRAKSVKSREEVALELIAKANVSAPLLLQEFLEKMKPNLEIPNTVPLRSCGDSSDYVYITMDLVRGITLQANVESGTVLTPAAAVKMILPVCEALDAAHKIDAFHNDLRPSNIVLTGDRGAVLMELGHAKKTDMEGKGFLKRDHWEERLPYLSPEATREKAVDAHSNIYSLGAILYFTLSGQAPFKSPTPLETVRAIRYIDLPKLNELRADLPAALAAAVTKAMEKDPGSRFKTVADLAEALKISVA